MYFKNRQAREAAQQSLQADLIKKFVEGPSILTVRENLKFLVEAGLLPEYSDRIQRYLNSNPTAAPQVPISVNSQQPPSRRPHLNAVLVGISQYESPSIPPISASKDAIDLGAELTAQGAVYASVSIKTFVDQSATKSQILNALSSLQQESSAIDTSVILLSGHSVQDDQSSYFPAYDFDSNKKVKSSLTGDEIQSRLAKIPGRVLVMLDTNPVKITLTEHRQTQNRQSTTGNLHPIGSVDKIATSQEQTNRNPSQNIGNQSREYLINQIAAAESGLIVVNAAQPGQMAMELISRGNGNLTYAMLSALRGGADLNLDGVIRTSELSDFLTKEVKN